MALFGDLGVLAGQRQTPALGRLDLHLAQLQHYLLRTRSDIPNLNPSNPKYARAIDLWRTERSLDRATDRLESISSRDAEPAEPAEVFSHSSTASGAGRTAATAGTRRAPGRWTPATGQRRASGSAP